MGNPRLSELEWTVLRDITEMHEHYGHVNVHRNMKEEEREAIGTLVLKGLLEIRATAKEQGYDDRRVVPTPVGRRLVAQANTADAIAGASNEVAA